jgi:Family of unknown function (DUF6056)
MLERRETRHSKLDFTEPHSTGLGLWGTRLAEILTESRLLLISRSILSLAIGLAAAAFLSLFPFTSPIADDYCRGAWGSSKNIFGLVIWEYRIWSGRWLSTLLHYLILPHINLSWMYGLVLAFFALAQIYSARIFIRTVLGATSRLSWALGVGGYIVWITSGPTISQNLYWLTGAIEYQFAFIAMLLLFSLLCQDHTSRLIAVFPVALSLLIPALNELAGATLISVLVILCGVLILERVGSRRIWLACLVAALISLSIVVASPGNKIRKAHDFPEGWQAAGVLPAAKSIIFTRVEWALNPVLFSATALWVLLPSVKRLRPAWTQIKPMYLFVVPVLIFSAWFAVDFALAWLTSGSPPLRVETWNHMVWSILWFLAVFAWTHNGAEKQPTATLSQTIFALMLSISILFAQNTKDAVSDLLKRAPAWHRAQLRRLHTTEKIALVPILPESPRSFFDEDITNDPEHWRNRCLADYLNIESIAVAQHPENSKKRAPQ